MDHRPKYKSQCFKVLKEKIWTNLCDLGLVYGFLDMTPKAQAAREKISE